MHDAAKPQGPNEKMRDAWRVACLAYRRERQKGELDCPAHVAAVKAVLEVMPDLTWQEASDQVQRAVAWAASEHPQWLWRGVGSR